MGKKIYKSLPDMSKARNRVDKPSLRREDIVVPPSVSSYAKGRKFFIKTFGCQANVRDEEIMAGYLEKAGFCRTFDAKEADFAIINTCAVRENAEEKVYGEIGNFKANHLRDKNFTLCVCGCMMQEEGAAKDIMARYPFVNIVFGTHNVDKLLDLLAEHLERKKDLVDILSYPGDIVENLPSTRLDSYKAYVNITYGCDKFCTYCIVPYTRGRERSRLKEDILAECKQLVDEGYQEITLLGQNVNSYGKDFQDGTTFAMILEEVAKLGIPRLRFMTSHPWDFSDEMLDVIAKYPNIMKCIHLPVQSGSDVVLRRMGRRYSREEYLDLVSRIRSRMPECALTTDIIVGFPDETEEDFQGTLSLAKAVGYDAAFTFIYSPRKGTPAAKMKDDVDDATKHRRFNELLKVIEESVVAHADAMIGKTYAVLVDGPSKKDPSLLSGYTESGKLVHFHGPSQLKGHIVNVRINESHAFSMIGTLVDDPLIVLANDLAKSLHKEEIFLRYQEAKRAFEGDESVKALRDELGLAQRKMSIAAKEDRQEDYQELRRAYLETKKRYENHPVVLNYSSASEDLRRDLDLIMEKLS